MKKVLAIEDTYSLTMLMLVSRNLLRQLLRPISKTKG